MQVTVQRKRHILIEFEVLAHPLQVSHILFGHLGDLSAFVFTELEGTHEYRGLGEFCEYLHRVLPLKLHRRTLYQLREQEFHHQHIPDRIVCLDRDTKVVCLLLFCLVEPQCIAEILQAVVGHFRVEVFGASEGIDEGVGILKTLFFQHIEIEVDVVGDKEVLRAVELFDPFSESGLAERRFVFDDLGGDVVHLHRFEADRHLTAAEFIIDLYLLFAVDDHRADLYDAVLFLVSRGFCVKEYIECHQLSSVYNWFNEELYNHKTQKDIILPDLRSMGERMDANAQLIEHMMNPQNYGSIENADAQGIGKNPENGEKVLIHLKVKEESGKPVIEDIKFQAIGCSTTVVAGSLITTEAKGADFDRAEDIVAYTLGMLERVPPEEAACSEMVAVALKAAMDVYIRRQTEPDFPIISYKIKNSCEIPEESGDNQ